MAGQVHSMLSDQSVKHLSANPKTLAGQRARRQLFTSVFLANKGDAKAAAIACGAAPRSAQVIGKRILSHPDVVKAINEHVQRVATRVLWSMDEKMQTLHEIAIDPRQPASSRISAISLAMDVTGDKAPSRSMSANITATVGPDGQITADPLAALAPRLDAWRRILQLRRPESADQTSPDIPARAQVQDANPQPDNTDKDLTADSVADDKD